MTKNTLIITTLIALVVAEGLFSFVWPAYAETCWYSVSEISSQTLKYPFLASGSGAIGYFSSFLKNYRLNCDKGYIFLIADYPQYYLQGASDALVYLNRPLYGALASPVFIFLKMFLHWPSFIVAFAAAIGMNYLLASAAVVLFYLLIKKLFSPRVAFLSAVFLATSPFLHIFINQPITEVLSVFIVVSSLFLFLNYYKKPSAMKLVVFSLLFGFLMLGKMIYALAFFIAFCAFYSKRWKEGFIFLLLQSVPVVSWYLIVKYVLGIVYYSHEISYAGVGSWLFYLLKGSWNSVATVWLNSLPVFFTATLHGFLFIPLIFAAYGLWKCRLPNKNFLALSFVGSFYLLSFVMVFWQPRLSFLMFPAVYSLTAYGLFVMKDSLFWLGRPWANAVFYSAILFIIFIANVNVYHIVNYG